MNTVGYVQIGDDGIETVGCRYLNEQLGTRNAMPDIIVLYLSLTTHESRLTTIINGPGQ
jgi:hypothetical protein